MIQERPGSAPKTGKSPIAGLKLLDFTHVFAGPFCTRNLADLGADVVHIESATRDPGDRVRAVYAHRNKRSIRLDLKNEAGYAVAKRLAATADVVVENFSTGVMRRLKLDYETLAKDNPRLIYVSLSGYGHTGPRSLWTSMNMNLQAYTGLMMTTGAEGDPPTAISNSWNDYIGGLHGIIAVLQALNERVESGRGRHIDLSQFECSVATLGPLLMASAVSGQPPKRWGSRASSAAPQGVYPCAGKDEWCAIVVEDDAQWQALAKTIGQPAAGADERFATAIGRLRHHDDLDALIGAWTRERTKHDVERELQAAGVQAERMRRVDDLLQSEDSAGGYLPVPNVAKPVMTAGVPFRFSSSTVEDVTAPCQLGEHTNDVCRDWLNVDAAEFADLEGRRAFG